jgi:putative integral membrane protein (TIGR02587 family)
MHHQTRLPAEEERSPDLRFGIGLARAVGGAVIFALPMLMTMEMWWLGFYMDRVRLAVLVVVCVPLLVGLSHVAGFEETFEPRQDILDAFVAYAVGFATSALVLALFGVLRSEMPVDEVVGKVALQAVPASIGALLAQSQLGGRRVSDEGGNTGTGGGASSGPEGRRPSTYASQLFLMAVGALFLAFNVAPTEEVVRIAYIMSGARALVLVGLSLVVMHAFVYALEFRGQEDLGPETPEWSAFLRFTVAGYAVALLICAYVLWTFGRLDGVGMAEGVATVIVLGFPAAIGAAAARLVL